MSAVDTLIVAYMKKQAFTGSYDGLTYSPYLRSCQSTDRGTGAVLVFTRDAGMHSGGWWKNPDYERCFHLSISFRHILTWEHKPKDARLTLKYLKAFFSADYRKTWSEGPKGEGGKKADCWHYRLFCDENWQVIEPRGEVYSKELTEAGWKSFSEVQEEKRKLQQCDTN